MKKLPSCECLPRKQRMFWSSLLTFLMAAVLAPVVAPAQTITTSGLITNAQEWSGTISLTGDITIGTGGAVTVDAGTTVQAKAGDDTGGGLDPSRIEIIVAGGSLTVNGTSNSPVFFTSASTNAAPASWYGVEYQSGSLTLGQAVINYGVNGLTVLDGGTEYFCELHDCRVFAERGGRVRSGVVRVSELPDGQQRSVGSECSQRHDVRFAHWRVGDEQWFAQCFLRRAGERDRLPIGERRWLGYFGRVGEFEWLRCEWQHQWWGVARPVWRHSQHGDQLHFERQ